MIASTYNKNNSVTKKHTMDFIVILLVTLVIFHLITFFGAIVIYMLLSLFVFLFGENEKYDEKIIYKIKF
jgi:hypothetical protein